MERNVESLTQRIQTLTSDQIVEVEDFIALLQSSNHDPALSRALASVSEPAFEAIWNNPEDDAYDAL